ncbi:Multidrug resistance-associated protein 4 [Physocladia obscura]|uniref:Multidrug resistance-associated protein 4 n=1 Tax=Physocladia obscura TaxID=109957 RepID=A0AAD5T3G6_9FUNG|nr:Multidrug resistance-associated protein 4 [Physocladia obscura]
MNRKTSLPGSTSEQHQLEAQTPTARENSSFLLRWSFSYITPVIKRGFRNVLKTEDYLPLESNDDASALSNRILSAWTAELQSGVKRPSLAKVSLLVFKTLIVGSALAYLVEMFVKIGEVLTMGALLNWFQNPNGDTYQGYVYGVLLFALGVVHAILHHVEFFLAMRCGMQMRVAFIAAIYKKCLTLSSAHTSSTGLIVNLVSNDVQRFEDASPFAHFIWLGPLEVILMLYFMYTQISYAAFAAVAALLALIPLQGYFGRIFARLRKQTLGLRDERIKSISDSLAGMLVLKVYAWEAAFEKSINGIRDQELSKIRNASYLRAANEAVFFASSSLIEIFAFITFWLIGGVFTPARIFTSIAYMSSIKMSMTNFFPKALQFLSESRISMDRIQEFLSVPDMVSHRNSPEAKELLKQYPANVDIIMENGTFGWTSSSSKTDINNSNQQQQFAEKQPKEFLVSESDFIPGQKSSSSPPSTAILTNINFSIQIGSLVTIVGPVGSGKTSLLNAILGEMSPLNSTTKIAVRSQKIAYCTQTPYILSGTVRDNVTFGLAYDSARFVEVIKVCAMDRDLEMFSNGELTVIGERGVTLSGGQRARLALARAVYSDADLYLLDDPLSAVDTKVGKHLFEECICKFLAGKTRVLVTHQLQFARRGDGDVVVLEQGKVAARGSYVDVIKAEGSVFAAAMKDLEVKASDDGDDGVDNLVVEQSNNPEKTVFVIEDAVNDLAKTKEIVVGTSPLIIKEEVATGLVMTDYFLSRWSLKTNADQRWIGNVGIFLALALGTLTISLVRAELFFQYCINSSEGLFRKMLHSVYRSPMSFFQQNPHGRLMNRFSKDINLADEMLPLTFFDFAQCSFLICGTFAVAIAIVPYVLVTVPIIAFVFVYLLRYYLATSRQIKRIESVTRSPIYATVPSTLEGLSTIRAYGSESRFSSEFMGIQNNNTRIFFCYLSSARWLGLRLDVLSAFFLGLISIGSAALKGPAGVSIGINSGTVGLLLTYSLQLVGTLQWAVRQSAEVENQMVSIERILEYTTLESEAPEITDIVPKDSWPSSGEIKISHMSMAYPTVPGKQILDDISVIIPGGMKVGVVGRTGAGKSSLLQVLFRLVEPTPANSIVLDDLPTSEVGLYHLRSRISIIPQEPFCFKGTLRYNLDPFGIYQDSELWNALDSVELKSSVELMAEKLESPVAENGSNWSVGERQLICLARAILRNSKLIVLDEATSAVDMRTDALVQRAIRSSTGLFASSTVLCIAHRLQTIIDFDRVLVLDYGKVVEYGPPHVLLQKDAEKDSGAWFARMVAQMGDDTQNQLKLAALEKWNETH